jgi:hypothetical protein
MPSSPTFSAPNAETQTWPILTDAEIARARPYGRVRQAELGEPVVKLIEKYSKVPMGLADACLVRMTESLADPIILTTDQDFRVYRRHSRQVVPCVTPE